MIRGFASLRASLAAQQVPPLLACPHHRPKSTHSQMSRRMESPEDLAPEGCGTSFRARGHTCGPSSPSVKPPMALPRLSLPLLWDLLTDLGSDLTPQLSQGPRWTRLPPVGHLPVSDSATAFQPRLKAPRCQVRGCLRTVPALSRVSVLSSVKWSRPRVPAAGDRLGRLPGQCLRGRGV